MTRITRMSRNRKRSRKGSLFPPMDDPCPPARMSKRHRSGAHYLYGRRPLGPGSACPTWASQVLRCLVGTRRGVIETNQGGSFSALLPLMRQVRDKVIAEQFGGSLFV